MENKNPRHARTMMEAFSIVLSPTVSEIAAERTAQEQRARWRQRWASADSDFLPRVLAVMAFLAFAAGALMSLRMHVTSPLDVAAVGRCYIATDGGDRWHCVRQCRLLSRAAHVESVSIADAKHRGGGRWQAPCRICGTLLRGNSAYRAKLEEYELMRRATGAP